MVNHIIAHICAQPVRPLIPARVTVKHRAATLKQRRNLTVALNYARGMRAPYTHRVALVAAITQESSANNLPYGSGTSVGVLQLIDSHGTVAWRMVIANSVGWFLRGARKIDPYGRRAPGALAQAVQRSAHPTAYNQWVSEAADTVAIYQGPCR